MTYAVTIAPAALRQIKKLPTKQLKNAVFDAIDDLAEDQHPPGCRKLEGAPRKYDIWRIEVEGSYRVIYRIRENVAEVLVVKVSDRKEVYRRIGDLKRLLQ